MTAVAHLLQALALALATVFLPACLVFGAQVLLYASRPKRTGDAAPSSAKPRVPFVILMPAHDEADGIAGVLAQLLPQLAPGDRVLVVADNCSDATAAIARDAGAEVVERVHADRGKGFALAFGIDALRAEPPAAVLILDADCFLAPGSLDALGIELGSSGRPVQALYLMTAPGDAALGRRLAQFAWRVRNWVRPAGWRRIDMPCQLMGTGMAFTWDMLADAPLANASIVEDMKLGIDLAAKGVAPIFCEQALVTSEFPDSASATATQRTRWEHGHMEMILREAPRMLRASLARGNRHLFGMSLDLAVPPLALLAGAACAACLLAVVGTAMGGRAWTLVVPALDLLLLAGAVLLAWAARGRDLVRFGELLSIPWYMASKLPMYVRFVLRRQREWVRTARK